MQSDIMKKVGSIQQAAYVRPITYKEGLSRDLQAYDVKNGKMSFRVLTDKCLDMSEFSYAGVNMSFLSKQGLEGLGRDDFDARSIMGGFFFTAGLDNVGGPCNVNGATYPQHGRIMQVERKEPIWHAPLDSLIDGKINEFINSEELQEKVDNLIKSFIEKILEEYHDQIPALIRERLDKLSDDELTTFVEGKVSDDLQMIRINGSVCGAAAGMFLYGVSLLIEKIVG